MLADFAAGRYDVLCNSMLLTEEDGIVLCGLRGGAAAYTVRSL